MEKKFNENDILSEIAASPSPEHPEVTSEIPLDEKEQKQEKELEKEDFISLVFNNKTASEKYKKDLIEKASKDPRSVQVKTPEGWMTVKEAIEAGFNPESGQFDKPGMPPVDMEGAMANMPPEDAEKMKGLMSPKNMQVPPEQMEEAGEGMFGQFGAPGAKPPMQGAPAPGAPLEEDPLAQTEEPGAPAAPDLSAILGGGGING